MLMPLHHKPVSANSYKSPCMGLHRLNYENPSGYNLMSMWPGQAARRGEELRPGDTQFLHNRFGLNKSGAQRSSSAPPPRQQPSACRLSIAAIAGARGRSRRRHGAAESSSCQPQKRNLRKVIACSKPHLRKVVVVLGGELPMLGVLPR